MPSEWEEPFKGIKIDGPNSSLFCRISSAVIIRSFKARVLSEKAVLAVAGAIEEGEEWMEQEMDLGNDRTLRLVDVSIGTLEQSYMLATSTYDEPHLAVTAVDLLCQIGLKFPRSDAVGALQRLTVTGEFAKALVYIRARERQLVVEVDVTIETTMALLLSHLRVLIQRKHYYAFSVLLSGVFGSGGLLAHQQVEESTGVLLEIMYLMAEFFLGTQEYKKVIQSLQPFQHIWGYQVGDETYERERRRVQMCVAKGYEVLGQLHLAKDLYSACGQGAIAREMQACISGERMRVGLHFGFQKPNCRNRGYERKKTEFGF